MNKDKEDKDTDISRAPSHNHQFHNPDALQRVAVTAQITIPPDGGWGWVVVVASFLIFAIGDGTVFTFGSLYKDLETDLDLTPAHVSLINSMTVSSSFICGPIVSAVINRYGFRICAMVGSAITSMSCLLTFLIGNYIALLLFYGLIAGLGFSMLNMPALLAVGFYFLKLRGVAFPCAIAGSSVGVIVLAYVYAHMARVVGWRYTIMFQACLTGFAYFVAMAYRPLLSMSVVVETDEDEERTDSGTLLSTVELKSGHGFRRTRSDEGLKAFRSNQNFPTAAQVLDKMSREASTISIDPSTPHRLSLIAMIPLNKHAEYHEHELERVMSLLDQIEEENEEIEEHEEAKFVKVVEKDKGETTDTIGRDQYTKTDDLEVKTDRLVEKDKGEMKYTVEKEDDEKKDDRDVNVDQLVEKDKGEPKDTVGKEDDDKKDNQEAKVDKKMEDKKTDDQEAKIQTTSNVDEDDHARMSYKVEFREKGESTEEPQTLDGRYESRRNSIIFNSPRSESMQFDRRRSGKESIIQFDRRRSQKGSTIQFDRRRSRKESTIQLDRRKSRIDSSSLLHHHGSKTKSLLFDKSRRDSFVKDVLHWEQHVPESRPMYRDDAFLDNTTATLTASHEEVAENPIEYQLRMSRVATKEDLKERKGMFTTAFTRVLFTMLDPHLLKRKSCLCVCFSMLFFYAAFLIPIIFMADRGLAFGIPYKYTKWLLSAVGVAAFFGRFIGSAIALRAHPLHILCGMYSVAGIATILSILGTTAELQFFYCVVYGITTCGTNSMRTAIFARLYGLENLTNCTGIAFLFQGVGCLLSPPIAGVLKGVWNQAHYIFSGFCFFCSAALFLPVLRLVEKENRLIEQQRLSRLLK